MYKNIEDATKVVQKVNMLYKKLEYDDYAALIMVIARENAIAYIAASSFGGERIKEFVNEIHALWTPANAEQSHRE